MAIPTYAPATIYNPTLEVYCKVAASTVSIWVDEGWIVIDPGGGVVPDNPLEDLFDRVDAIEALGPLATDVELGAHAANLAAHGVTRELITFTAATPVHIPGNLLSHDVQRGISGWSFAAAGITISSVAGGADGGGATRFTIDASGGYGWTYGTPGICVPNTSYTGSARIVHTGAVDREITLAIVWLDSSGGWIDWNISTRTIPPGVTSTYSVTGTSPANAARALLTVVPTVAFLVGETIDISVACIRTSPTVPGSTGVVGLIGHSGNECLRVDSNGQLVITLGPPGWGGAALALPAAAGLVTARCTAWAADTGNRYLLLTDVYHFADYLYADDQRPGAINAAVPLSSQVLAPVNGVGVRVGRQGGNGAVVTVSPILIERITL